MARAWALGLWYGGARLVAHELKLSCGLAPAKTLSACSRHTDGHPSFCDAVCSELRRFGVHPKDSGRPPGWVDRRWPAARIVQSFSAHLGGSITPFICQSSFTDNCLNICGFAWN